VTASVRLVSAAASPLLHVLLMVLLRLPPLRVLGRKDWHAALFLLGGHALGRLGLGGAVGPNSAHVLGLALVRARLAEDLFNELIVRYELRIKDQPQSFGVTVARADRLVGGVGSAAASVADRRRDDPWQAVVLGLRMPESPERESGHLESFGRRIFDVGRTVHHSVWARLGLWLAAKREDRHAAVLVVVRANDRVALAVVDGHTPAPKWLLKENLLLCFLFAPGQTGPSFH